MAKMLPFKDHRVLLIQDMIRRHSKEIDERIADMVVPHATHDICLGGEELHKVDWIKYAICGTCDELLGVAIINNPHDPITEKDKKQNKITFELHPGR